MNSNHNPVETVVSYTFTVANGTMILKNQITTFVDNIYYTSAPKLSLTARFVISNLILQLLFYPYKFIVYLPKQFDIR